MSDNTQKVTADASTVGTGSINTETKKEKLDRVLPGLKRHGFADEDKKAKDHAIEIMETLTEDTMATWIDFWDYVFGDGAQKGLIRFQKNANKVLDVIEKGLIIAKTLVSLAAAFAGFLLDLINAYLMLARTLLKMLKALIKKILDLLNLPLFRHEIKFATYNHWSPMNELNVDLLLKSNNLFSVTRQKIVEMTHDWMNRPQAMDELCLLIFFPVPIPPEVARATRASVRLKDIIADIISRLNNYQDRLNAGREPIPEPPLEGIQDNIIETLNVFSRALDRDTVKLEEGSVEKIKALIARIKPVSDTYTKEVIRLSRVYTEIEGAEARLAADLFEQENNNSSVPGVLDYVFIEKEDSLKMETNFRNNENRYLSKILYRNPDGTVGTLYDNPGFKALKALRIPELYSQYLFYTEMFALTLEVGRKLYNKTNQDAEAGILISTMRMLLETINEHILNELFGDYYTNEWDKVESRKTIPPIIPSTKRCMLMLLSNLAADVYFIQEDVRIFTRDLDDGKFPRALNYGTRTSLTPDFRKFPPDIIFKTPVKEGAKIVFMLESSKTIYLDSDILEADKKVRTFRAYAGDIEAIDNTLVLSGVVASRGSDSLLPRWYGVETPDWLNSWNGNKLLSTLLPDSVLDSVDNLINLLDNLIKYLDSAMEFSNEIREKIRALERMLLGILDQIHAIVKAIRDFINALSFSNLPTIHIAAWKGSSDRIPDVIMRALLEKRWHSSTVAGGIAFASGAAAAGILKGYKIIEQTKKDLDTIERRADHAANLRKDTGEFFEEADAKLRRVDDNFEKKAKDREKEFDRKLEELKKEKTDPNPIEKDDAVLWASLTQTELVLDALTRVVIRPSASEVMRATGGIMTTEGPQKDIDRKEAERPGRLLHKEVSTKGLTTERLRPIPRP